MTEIAIPIVPVDSLPIQSSQDRPFLDLYTLVPHVMDLYPDWTEDDLLGFVEEKTRNHLNRDDIITLRKVYLRCYRLRTEFEG